MESTEKTDIGITGIKIVFICNLDGVKCNREIDAEGKYVLPGVIDGHMHVEAPMCGGLLSADDYYTQSISTASSANLAKLYGMYPQKGVI